MGHFNHIYVPRSVDRQCHSVYSHYRDLHSVECHSSAGKSQVSNLHFVVFSEFLLLSISKLQAGLNSFLRGEIPTQTARREQTNE